jgi:hypothetical protein
VHEQVAGELREAADELRHRAERAEGEAAALRDALVQERARAEAAAAEREQARVQAAAAAAEAKKLRLALEEARRPFWRRWLVLLCHSSCDTPHMGHGKGEERGQAAPDRRGAVRRLS